MNCTSLRYLLLQTLPITSVGYYFSSIVFFFSFFASLLTTFRNSLLNINSYGLLLLLLPKHFLFKFCKHISNLIR